MYLVLLQLVFIFYSLAHAYQPQIHETKLEDKFEEDQRRFKNGYPALQNRTIVKDLIY